MSLIEIAFYVAVYAIVLVLGYGWINKGRSSDAMDPFVTPNSAENQNFANQNYERPMIGTGIGYKKPNASYAKISSSRKS